MVERDGIDRGRFQPATDLGTRPTDVLEREQGRVQALVPRGSLELTGGSSLPGALTGGDIDLHLRVPPADFAAAVAALSAIYDVVLPEIWAPTLATFALRGGEDVGIAVTPIGSEHDRRFVAAWSTLREDRGALGRYNDMKAAHAGTDDAAYRRAKAAFFDELGRES